MDRRAERNRVAGMKTKLQPSQMGVTGLIDYVWGDGRPDFTAERFSMARMGVAMKILRARGKNEDAVASFVKAVKYRFCQYK